jgi:hypothetical protein
MISTISPLPHGLGRSAKCEIKLFLTPAGTEQTGYRTVNLKYDHCSSDQAKDIQAVAQSIFDASNHTIEVCGEFRCDRLPNGVLVTTLHTTEQLLIPRNLIDRVSYYQHETTTSHSNFKAACLVAVYLTPQAPE